jgi:hypothetical protein
MIGFLLKKTFFDLWDNAFRLTLLNAGFAVSVLFFMLIHRLLEMFSPVPAVVSGSLFFLGASWCSAYLAAAAACVKNISDYSSFGVNDFIKALPSVWAGGLVYGAYACIAVINFIFIIPFYLLLNTTGGLFAASLVFWVTVGSAVIFQYFFAVRLRFGIKITKTVKKCLLLFIDNPLFFIGTMFLSALFLAVSAPLAFLLPGPAGLMLFLDESLRLRLMKYDWLEQNVGSSRGYIPWDKILTEEREKTGNRTLRGLIFPWKD